SSPTSPCAMPTGRRCSIAGGSRSAARQRRSAVVPTCSPRRISEQATRRCDMTVTGFWHGGITVADTERSHGFYVGLLGLRVFADRIVDDPALLRVVATQAPALRVSMLEIPGVDCYVELVEYLGVDAG